MRLLEPSRNYRLHHSWQEEDRMTGWEDEERKDAHMVYWTGNGGRQCPEPKATCLAHVIWFVLWVRDGSVSKTLDSGVDNVVCSVVARNAGTGSSFGWAKTDCLSCNWMMCVESGELHAEDQAWSFWAFGSIESNSLGAREMIYSTWDVLHKRQLLNFTAAKTAQQ